MDEKKKNPKPLNDKVKSLDININEFGEITSSMLVDDLNKYLNKTVNDKKLKDQTLEEE